MTAAEFQRELIGEVEKILRDIQTQNTSGELVTGVKGYEQMLPIVEDDEEDESQFFPYFIVKMGTGKTEDDESPWIVTTDIILGCYDNSAKTNGHRHILNMIQRICDRFAAEPLMNNKYRAEQNMEWALQDEDTHPFYFGGVEIKFNIPKIGRRVPDYGQKENQYC